MTFYEKNAGLWGAARYGDIAAVKSFLAAGADVDSDNGCALRWAVTNGDEETTKFLLEVRANLHVLGDMPLLDAYYAKHNNIAKMLLEAGADWKILKLGLSSKEEAIKYFELMTI